MISIALASALLIGQVGAHKPRHHLDPVPEPAIIDAAPEVDWKPGDLAIVGESSLPYRDGSEVRLIVRYHAHWAVRATDGTGDEFNVPISGLSRPEAGPPVYPSPLPPARPTPQALVAPPAPAVPTAMIIYSYPVARAPALTSEGNDEPPPLPRIRRQGRSRGGRDPRRTGRGRGQAVAEYALHCRRNPHDFHAGR